MKKFLSIIFVMIISLFATRTALAERALSRDGIDSETERVIKLKNQKGTLELKIKTWNQAKAKAALRLVDSINVSNQKAIGGIMKQTDRLEVLVREAGRMADNLGAAAEGAAYLETALAKIEIVRTELKNQLGKVYGIDTATVTETNAKDKFAVLRNELNDDIRKAKSEFETARAAAKDLIKFVQEKRAKIKDKKNP